ncbi:MAG: LPS export ABC transporter ATP-binding protein [Proteobacteria bacterium]|nr:LPS export ABC transporter ATP-binding protein [Pseudomonadota bacterium]
MQQRKGLWADNIRKSFDKKTVLLGVSVGVGRGECVGLLGPNGAGKTTCFSILTGILKPDSGSVYYNNQDVTHLPMYQRARLGISYLPQDSSIFRGLTVENNIRAVLEINEKDPDKLEERLDELLELFSISHIRESAAISLSGGERRRTEIARCLAINPSILMLDEPLAGIDPIAVKEVQETIITLKNLGIGILITDHNVRETLDIVDRAYIVAEGRVLAEGNTEQLINNKDVKRVYLGHDFNM